MRRLFVGMVCFALVAGLSVSVGAVGLQVVGKEDCNCSGLEGRGIIPDPVNKIHDALYFPKAMGVLDQVAIGVRTFVTQIGKPEAVEAESHAVTEEAAPPRSSEKAHVEEKIEKTEKPAKEEKAIKKRTPVKKKPAPHAKKTGKKSEKVKVPPQAK